jgi:polysaccharide export outer membrane protein
MKQRILPLTICVMVFVLASLACRTSSSPVSIPAAYSQSTAGYELGPEDVVEVWIWKEPELSTTAVVRPDGMITIPLIGELQARGSTAVKLEEVIKQRLTKFISEPVVNVIVKEVNYPRISVLGQVRKPDVYRVRQRITVLEAIALAGGFTEYAKRDSVRILRNSTTPAREYELDLENPGPREAQFYLQPFDTVHVQ